VPGGTYLGSFRPFLAFAQNLLPFDRIERARAGFGLKYLRLRLLEQLQGRTFRRASGVIYMSALSKEQIERRIRFRPSRSRVVHHGTSARFRIPLSADVKLMGVDLGSLERPLRLLYVSILEPYKHQLKVVNAVARLRGSGRPVVLDLVGPAAEGEAEALTRECARLGLGPEVVRYHGSIPYEQLEFIYSRADAFVFASSCETFGIILLEAMAAGLPLLCSSRSSLPEVAGDAGLYFDPLDVSSLVRSLTSIYDDQQLRESLAFRSRRRAAGFSWERCAQETFDFVREVYDAHRATKGT
jgi:glycosyltransferase involved in cell wall biosynthesis